MYLGNSDNKNLLRLKPLYVLYAVVLVFNFLPIQISSITFICLALISLIFGNNSVSNYLKIVWPLTGIFVIGIVGLYGHAELDIARDIVYALSPISLIYLGDWLAGRGIGVKELMKPIMFFGILLALIYLSKFALNPELIGADLITVRSDAYVFGDLVVLALVLGLFQKQLGLGNLFPRFLPRYVWLVFLFLSFVLSYSRTEFVVFMVLSFALLGYLHRVNPRFILVVATLSAIFFIIATIDVDDRSLTFESKLLRSLIEIKVSDYQDIEDINYNWRGFETYRVIETYMSGSELQKIFGQGFGSLVSLGFTMNLAGSDYEYIPVVHNGYGYVLFKTGLIGILLYLMFYLKIVRIAARHSNSNNPLKKYLALLLLGIILCLIITMYVIGGLAQVHSAEFTLLIGYLTRRLATERDIVS